MDRSRKKWRQAGLCLLMFLSGEGMAIGGYFVVACMPWLGALLVGIAFVVRIIAVVCYRLPTAYFFPTEEMLIKAIPAAPAPLREDDATLPQDRLTRLLQEQQQAITTLLHLSL